MKKNKLALREITVKSFVTKLDSNSQKSINGGETSQEQRTVRITCGATIEPQECNQTGRVDCSELVTNDPDICEDLLN